MKLGTTYTRSYYDEPPGRARSRAAAAATTQIFYDGDMPMPIRARIDRDQDFFIARPGSGRRICHVLAPLLPRQARVAQR